MKNQNIISTQVESHEDSLELYSECTYFQHLAFYQHLYIKRLEDYLSIEITEQKLSRLKEVVDNAVKHEFYNHANEGMITFSAPRLPQGFNRGDVINEEEGIYA